MGLPLFAGTPTSRALGAVAEKAPGIDMELILMFSHSWSLMMIHVIYIFNYVINWCTIWWLLTWPLEIDSQVIVCRWRSTLIQFSDGTSSNTSWIRPLKSLAGASDSPWPGRPGRPGLDRCDAVHIISYLYISVAVHKPWMPRTANCQNF